MVCRGEQTSPEAGSNSAAKLPEGFPALQLFADLPHAQAVRMPVFLSDPFQLKVSHTAADTDLTDPFPDLADDIVIGQMQNRCAGMILLKPLQHIGEGRRKAGEILLVPSAVFRLSCRTAGSVIIRPSANQQQIRPKLRRKLPFHTADKRNIPVILSVVSRIADRTPAVAAVG